MERFENPKNSLEDKIESNTYENIADDTMEEIKEEMDDDVKKYYEEHKEQIDESHKKCKQNFIETLSKLEENKSSILPESVNDFAKDNALEAFKTAVKNIITKGYEYDKEH